jgi:hypothetical protein
MRGIEGERASRGVISDAGRQGADIDNREH